ncbi:hypothetical protein [Almyronema epifaneia]|uniref:Uncharacterized protein n=1 Tax=Almyronema epifaneia S1 TaxID=2991925 RepID=A0ABW6IHL4_9CYAN
MKFSLPARIVLRIVTLRKTLLLTAYTEKPEAIAEFLCDRLRQEGGQVISHVEARSSKVPPLILIGARLASFSSADVWQIRSVMQLSGAVIETVHIDYSETKSLTHSDRARLACQQCRYAHSQPIDSAHFICALYPLGPEADPCSDWAAADSQLA